MLGLDVKISMLRLATLSCMFSVNGVKHHDGRKVFYDDEEGGDLRAQVGVEQ